MDILDDMGVSKLSAKVSFKVNYSFKYLKSTQRNSTYTVHLKMWLAKILRCFVFGKPFQEQILIKIVFCLE